VHEAVAIILEASYPRILSFSKEIQNWMSLAHLAQPVERRGRLLPEGRTYYAGQYIQTYVDLGQVRLEVPIHLLNPHIGYAELKEQPVGSRFSALGESSTDVTQKSMYRTQAEIRSVQVETIAAWVLVSKRAEFIIAVFAIKFLSHPIKDQDDIRGLISAHWRKRYHGVECKKIG
jgi:hypothetical protein